jgi:hypothetical protein
VCRPLLTAGHDLAELHSMTLGQLPPSAALDRLRRRRAELGFSAGDDSPLVIDPQTGTAVTAEGLPLHLRRAQTTRVSIEANAGICRGMLWRRYAGAGVGEDDQ